MARLSSRTLSLSFLLRLTSRVAPFLGEREAAVFKSDIWKLRTICNQVALEDCSSGRERTDRIIPSKVQCY